MGFSLPLRRQIIATAVTAAVTFKDVLRGTPPNRFTGAEKVKVRKVKLTRRGTEVVKIESQCYTPGSATSYDTEIELLPNKKVKLSCSCDDFVFRFEWVLYRKGGADLRYGNGESPDKTNPAQTLGCCKHLVALREAMVTKGYIEPAA